MKAYCLSTAQQQIRANVRNYLYPATLEQMKRELAISYQRHDVFRAACVQECINEAVQESAA